MEAETRKRIEQLVRQATLAFYDESTKAEMDSRVDVDYLTREDDGHKVMVFAPSHEYEHERSVWAEIGEVTVDLEPEKVGLSSYHVHVEITDSGDNDDGFAVGDQDRDD